jgi:hypothetical protein
MSGLLFNHPHRDSFNGDIVVPYEIRYGHIAPSVMYRIRGQDTTRIMTLKTWLKYCEPILFETEEGA